MDDFANQARVFDGARWDRITNERDKAKDYVAAPVSPEPDGNGQIFVSIVSFRDSKRCAKTLKNLFQQAKEPNKVVVGLVDQVNTEDREATCLEEYCKLMGKNGITEQCKNTDRVRVIGFFSKAAAGPGVARALQRKNLANEEFCLQIDSHSEFTKDWDALLKQEWHMANNEYAVISTLPPSTASKADFDTGGPKSHQVPRICHTSFTSIKIPTFVKQPTGLAERLTKPLLAHAWCAGFSFHKCHLEEFVPYDYFLPQIFDGEEFPRYARMWTRGYDVYTPTRNIVFHDEGPNPDGYDMKGWPRRDILRNQSLKRIKTILQMQDGDGHKAHANLGILGLGKRRSLSQLEDFVGVDLSEGTGGQSSECGNLNWVSYDPWISSAKDNLYEHAEDLDPQPEFPLRTISSPMHASGHGLFDAFAAAVQESSISEVGSSAVVLSSVSSRIFVFILWISGLGLWYRLTSSKSSGSRAPTRPRVRRPITKESAKIDEAEADGHKTV